MIVTYSKKESYSSQKCHICENSKCVDNYYLFEFIHNNCIYDAFIAFDDILQTILIIDAYKLKKEGEYLERDYPVDKNIVLIFFKFNIAA